jgi:hypothetical protein
MTAACIASMLPTNRDARHRRTERKFFPGFSVTIRTQRVQQVKTETVTDAPYGFEAHVTVEGDTRFRCQAKPDVMVHCASYQ